MKKVVDLTGQKFGRLTILSRNLEYQKKDKYHKVYWNCLCDCGANIVCSSINLKSGNTKSCGCLRNEKNHAQKNTKSNQWIEEKDCVVGITCKGEKFYIDKEDYEKVKNYCWRIDKNSGYVIANSRNGSNKVIFIHRIIMDPKDEELIDHKNWNKADNRKSNLRIATKSENNINIKRKINNSTGYTGVTKEPNGYKARISKNGTRYDLGTYESFEEAVKIRHQAEIKIHKEWSGEINRKDFEKVFSNEIIEEEAV